MLRGVGKVSEYRDEDPSIIAKEITLALVQKNSMNSDKMIEYACNAYDKVYKQVVKTTRETK